MNDSHFRFTKIQTAAILAISFLSFVSVRQVSASGFSVSLNLGETAIALGIGDAVAVASAPTVEAPSSALLPPSVVAPIPRPHPRCLREVAPAPIPMEKRMVPAHIRSLPPIRRPAPAKAPKNLRSRPPREVGRARH